MLPGHGSCAVAGFSVASFKTDNEALLHAAEAWHHSAYALKGIAGMNLLNLHTASRRSC